MDPNCVNVMYCLLIDMYYDEVSYGWDDNCIQNQPKLPTFLEFMFNGATIFIYIL